MKSASYNHSDASLKRSNDFGTANKAAGLIHKTFLPYFGEFWDKHIFKRIKKSAIWVVNMGPPEKSGELKFIDGYVEKLDFEFNVERNLNRILDKRPVVYLENADFIRVSIPIIDPKKDIRHSFEATSAVFRLVCGVFHFDLEKSGATNLRDLELPFNKIFPGANIRIPLQAAENSVIYVAMCMWLKKNTSPLLASKRWYAGNVIAGFNIVDGEVKLYKESPEKLKRILSKKKIEEKKDGLDWEINDPG